MNTQQDGHATLCCMQSQIEAEDVAQSGIVDCFDLAQ